MDKYKNLYIWMIIPMVIMQAGIFGDYWGDFVENAWTVHTHYWIATVWYLYLILQPYFVAQGKMDLHRTNGIIGMFLAGGVCITALSMMHRDIESAHSALEMPEQFGPFLPWFFYGVIVVEIVMVLAFGFAVIKSILHRKSIEDHSWWLISTVFIIMMPALGRGIQNVHIGLNIEAWPDIDIMSSLYFTEMLIIGMALIFAWKYGKLKHPATYLIVGVNLFNLLIEPIGKSEGVQTFLEAVIKG